jgi:hypothetical protein
MKNKTARLLLLLLCNAAVMFAVPVRWTLSGVTFADGGTASGSFIFDADTNTFSSVNITTTTTGTFTGQTYITAVTPESTGLFAVVVTTGAFTTGTPDLFLFPVSPLTNAGGNRALHVGASPNLDSSEGACADPACDAPAVSPIRQVSAGSLVGSLAIPAMSPLALVILGVLLSVMASLLIRRSAAPRYR